ncbi:MAG: UvrD-helicase domain-containing protein [Pirellulales bacterium]|nr:UvrD-helicase domain-containing protein [Pirellulales bacterium]
MASAKLNEDQQRARDTRDVSVALSAGAGCGKTHVLTERFLSHLDPTTEGESTPAALHQLIAITFTDAAAREMRSRIRAACYDRLDNQQLGDADRAAWLRLLREIDSARVSTIHAFCTALLRTYAAEAGLDPRFGVLEQGEADLLLEEVSDAVLRQKLSERDADTLDLAAEFGRLSSLKENLAVLVDQRHRPAFAKWMTAPETEPATAKLLVAKWHEVYDREGARFAAEKAAQKVPVQELLRLLALATPAASNDKFVAARAELFEALTRFAGQPNQITKNDLDSIITNAAVKYICTKKDWPSTQAYEAYRDACKKARDTLSAAMLPTWDDNGDEVLKSARMGLKLVRLAGEVAAAYYARKQQLAKLDFDDLLTLAHRLLADENHAELRDALSADLQLLLVDEFQDTDPLQVDLIRRICGAGFDEGRLFFVGDFKQSIYRFRGAVPPEFLKLRAAVPKGGQLVLKENYRSQPGVLHFVNALFHGEFPEYVPLVPQRQAANDRPAVEFLWSVPPSVAANVQGDCQGSDEAHVIPLAAGTAASTMPPAARSKPKKEDSRKQEAATIARRLRQLIDGEHGETPILDRPKGKGQPEVAVPPRAPRPGDIAILFRALSDVRYYEEALRAEGIEYYLVGGHAFYAQQEVFDVLNLLRSVASTVDEISLAGALRSPFFATTDETLFWLVEHGKGTTPDLASNAVPTAVSFPLNAGLFAEPLPPELPEEEAAKVLRAAQTLGYLRAIKNAVPIAELLNEVLERTGYDAVLLAEFLGERKLANLHKLIEQARSADGSHRDLNDYIVQLSEYIRNAPKEPLASTCAESANVVRLMTIHAAKGLEFPLVVVPDLDRAGYQDRRSAALDDDLGPVIKPFKDDSEQSTLTGFDLFSARERAAELEERKRLLYVATTRAADYLILSSSLESLDKLNSDWMEFLADHFDLDSGDYRGELPADYEHPRVRVTKLKDVPPTASRPRGPDLLRVLEEANALVADGASEVPLSTQPIPPNNAALRQFSYSSICKYLSPSENKTRIQPPALIRIQPPALPGVQPSTHHEFAAPLRQSRELAVESFERNEPAVEPRSLGNLVHDVLARLDFASPQVAEEASDWCRRLATNHAPLQGEEAARLAAEMVTRFAASARARQLAAAHTIHREIEFLLPFGRGAANAEPPREYPFIRGYIDCLYQDPSGLWRILDYKTNYVAAADAAGIESVASRYRLQLELYALAAEQALGTSPAEVVLVLLSPGIERVIGWNESARQQAQKELAAALYTARNTAHNDTEDMEIEWGEE